MTVLDPTPTAGMTLPSRARVARVGALLVLVARPALAFVGQATAAILLSRAGSTDPWREAAPWFQVSTSMMDVGCLALLAWLERHEGIRLSDLVGCDRQHLRAALLLGLGLIPVAMPIVFLGSAATSLLIRGSVTAPSLGGPLPLWAGLYATLVWPVGVGFVEEMTYQGYALPHLRALFGCTLPAYLLVTCVWSFQHIGEPFVPDSSFVLWRATQFLPLALLFGAIYLWRGRLVPLIVAHVGIDLLGGLFQSLLPAIAAAGP